MSKGRRANEALTIAPLRNMPVVKDLACRHGGVLRQMGAGGRAVRAERCDPDDFAVVRPEMRRAARPTPGSNASAAACATPPATSSRGTRTISAPPRSTAPGRWSTMCATARRRSGFAAVAGDAGCHACHSHQSCREFCPKHLNPADVDRGAEARNRRGDAQGRDLRRGWSRRGRNRLARQRATAALLRCAWWCIW